MPEYKCPRCNYKSYYKNDIKRHFNNKIQCKVAKDGMNVNVRENQDILLGNIDPMEYLKQDLKIKELEEDLIKLKLELVKYKKSGYIYILHNPSFESWGDNIYKVGCSENPERRLKDFSTSYPTESRLVYKSILFDNKLKAEQDLFKIINKYRFNTKREFFDIPLDILIKHIESLSS